MSQNLIEELDLSDMHKSMHFFINKTMRAMFNQMITDGAMTKEKAIESINEIREGIKNDECDYCHKKGHNYQHHLDKAAKFMIWQEANKEFLEAKLA